MIDQVVIIGAGPAGLAAAIQLRRYGLMPRIFEHKEVGALLWNANLVENYPGFPRGISGPKLVQLFLRQAQHVGVEITSDDVKQVDYKGGIFQVKTMKDDLLSRVVIVATGTRPLRIADFDIPADLHDRVFYEVVDLLHLEQKKVLIIGSGDAAFDYALNLSKKNQVTILNRADQPKCLPLLWERSRKIPNIQYLPQIKVFRLEEDSKGSMLVHCQTSEGELQFHPDYLLIAIGREANLDCLSESLRQQQTSLEQKGILHVIGDVKNGIYRQTSIAVGEGVMAAMKIYAYL
jgi:thioredoxin reductase